MSVTRNARRIVAVVSVAAFAASAAWGQQSGSLDALTQQMVSLVLAHNPTIVSRQRIVDESRQLPDRAAGLAVPGVSFGAGVSVYNPTTNAFSLLPSVTVGLSLSLNDPARDMSILKMKEEKETAWQALQEAKDAALAALFSTVRDILKLKSQGKNLADLGSYLRDFSAVAESQGSSQSVSPDKLWDLRQRIADLQTQLDTLDADLETTMMESAMSLGGDAWQELLGLLRQLGA
jgi:hypothetical protein